MKAKTEEFLYFLLWTCDRLTHPTFRNLTESFEGWAYRNGLHTRLWRLEKQQLIESKSCEADQRLLRLTEAGRLVALGGRDPEACWKRPWDGVWRLVLFDVPLSQNGVRNKLRKSLRAQGYGYLQHSVWLTPHPHPNESRPLTSDVVDVGSLILLEARPHAGETDAQIVAGAWDFPGINQKYAEYLEVLRQLPRGEIGNEQAAQSLLDWARRERRIWHAAVSMDPLLPACLLPSNYSGQVAWEERKKALAQAGEQMRGFDLGRLSFQ